MRILFAFRDQIKMGCEGKRKRRRRARLTFHWHPNELRKQRDLKFAATLMLTQNRSDFSSLSFSSTKVNQTLERICYCLTLQLLAILRRLIFLSVAHRRGGNLNSKKGSDESSLTSSNCSRLVARLVNSFFPNDALEEEEK